MGFKFSKIEDPDQSMWCLKCNVDSYWAGDNVSRKSVSALIVYVQNNPTEWGSLQQQIILTSIVLWKSEGKEVRVLIHILIQEIKSQI